MKKRKIDVIIPAYKAHNTIHRTLASIAAQTIIEDVSVTIVNDACPEGDYREFVDMYERFFPIREAKLEENAGPGVARQTGIDVTDGEYFTCIDADDTFSSPLSLEIMRTAMEQSPVVKCVSGTFVQLGEDLKHMLPHQMDMVWMFGKLYRRDFVKRYGIRFNDTRANEDTGFNTIVRLLCDNQNEQISFVNENVYFWHNKEDSITRINAGQYGFDQCFCGWTDNMVYSIEHVRKLRPFSGSVNQWVVSCMMQLYYYWVETYARKPVFADQNWEYVKKFYHSCYKRVEGDISDQVFAEMFSMCSREKYASGSMLGFVPHISIKDFMERLHSEPYDPEEIYRVWQRMKEDPETQKLIENNIKCGVCKEGYTNKPF